MIGYQQNFIKQNFLVLMP